MVPVALTTCVTSPLVTLAVTQRSASRSRKSSRYAPNPITTTPTATLSQKTSVFHPGQSLKFRSWRRSSSCVEAPWSARQDKNADWPLAPQRKVRLHLLRQRLHRRYLGIHPGSIALPTPAR